MYRQNTQARSPHTDGASGLRFSPGLEGIADVFDGGAALLGRPCDRYYVETGREVRQPMPLQPQSGSAGEALLLARAHRLGWVAAVVRSTSFHLDKYHHAPINGHEVDLAVQRPGAAVDDLIAQPPQKTAGSLFAALPK